MLDRPDILRGIGLVAFDVDGVLADYHKGPDEGVKDTLRELGSQGLNLCIISNAYGERVSELDEMFGLPFGMRVYTPASVTPAGEHVSDYRKPNPAMLERAAQDHEQPLKGVLAVGDQLFKDIVSANRAGAPSLYLPRRGRGDHPAVRALQRPPEAFLRVVLDIKFPKVGMRGEAV